MYVTPKHKIHSNICLDFLVSNHIATQYSHTHVWDTPLLLGPNGASYTRVGTVIQGESLDRISGARRRSALIGQSVWRSPRFGGRLVLDRAVTNGRRRLCCRRRRRGRRIAPSMSGTGRRQGSTCSCLRSTPTTASSATRCVCGEGARVCVCVGACASVLVCACWCVCLGW